MQNAVKRLKFQAHSETFSISMYNLFQKEVKLFVEMLNGNNDLHMEPLMTECMHGIHAQKSGMRPV